MRTPRGMHARVFLTCAIIILFANSCSLSGPRAVSSAPQAKDFEAAIARIARADPGSPAVLSAQLAYAEFLLSEASDSCEERLERAQEQLVSVDASPKARVMFPDGWARLADLEYRLHLARTACGSEADQANELRAAAAAARRAVELYRNVFDYHSMVVMQFDAGITLHQLGENTAALADLETAIDMDREYGFQDDASENYKLLLTWSGKPAGAAQVAELMQDFPQRRVTLKFGWHPSDARITLETRREFLNDGQIGASRAVATFERHIGANDDGGWIVSHAHRLTQYEPGVWATIQGSQTPPIILPPAALPAVNFKVSTAGEFEGVTDSESFATRLATKTEGLIRAAAPPGDLARSLTREAVESATVILSPGMLEAATAENYQLETAMWIGATLDQGVWYEISAPLSLPGAPRVVLQNQIQFAFTRMVPCTAGAKKQTCVEIVFHATPEEESLDHMMRDLRIQFWLDRFTYFTASTEVRIVTDPATLMTYAREEWVSWYGSLGKSKKDKVLQSEHLVSTTSYGAD